MRLGFCCNDGITVDITVVYKKKVMRSTCLHDVGGLLLCMGVEFPQADSGQLCKFVTSCKYKLSSHNNKT